MEWTFKEVSGETQQGELGEAKLNSSGALVVTWSDPNKPTTTED